MAVWEINLKGLKPTTRLVTKIPEAAILNGITTVSDCSSSYVLIADSGLSRVWRVDVKTGQYETAAEVPEMQFIANATLKIGVNGVKTHDGQLYFSNSNYASIYRLPIDKNGVAAKGLKQSLSPISTLPVSTISRLTKGAISGLPPWTILWQLPNRALPESLLMANSPSSLSLEIQLWRLAGPRAIRISSMQSREEHRLNRSMAP